MNDPTTSPINELTEAWEFGVLDVYDYRRPGPLQHFYDYLRASADRPGDVCEVGVFRGRSLVATALLLRQLGVECKLYGFDSFSGFPSYSGNDQPERFAELHAQGRISDEHFARVQRNWAHLASLGRGDSVAKSSSSGDFSSTSLALVRAKLEHLGIRNVELVPGAFGETLGDEVLADVRFRAALLDCDLYESYHVALPWVWDRMLPGGLVYLDEYYSLKFPGARIAVDEFCERVGASPVMLSKEDGFERWGLSR